MIAAYAAAVAIKPEPRDTRMLVASGGGIVAVTPDGEQKQLAGIRMCPGQYRPAHAQEVTGR